MTNAQPNPTSADEFSRFFDLLRLNIEQVIKGKPGEIRLVLTALVAEGHVLIDDVPGTGKTSLAKAVSHSIGGTWNRIQFTPDLLPSHVTGSMVYRGDAGFEFHEGAVFANIVLADEINRASPKTQSALLEVMEERQVSVENETRSVPTPFSVIATQNPVEFDGTYHLPEAQIDRFMVRLSMGYPSHEAEVQLASNHLLGVRVDALEPVLSLEQVRWMIEFSKSIHVSEAVKDYVVALVRATRTVPEQLRLGVSPRGTVALLRAGQVWAASRGRHFVSADDIKSLAPFILSHRMLLQSDAEIQGVRATDLLSELLSSLPLPSSES